MLGARALLFWAFLRESVSYMTGLMHRGEKLWRAKPAFPDHTPEGVRLSGNVSTVPYLREAALQMLKQGCGEGWLLQPKILDMPDLEYRSDSPPVYVPQSVVTSNAYEICRARSCCIPFVRTVLQDATLLLCSRPHHQECMFKHLVAVSHQSQQNVMRMRARLQPPVVQGVSGGRCPGKGHSERHSCGLYAFSPGQWHLHVQHHAPTGHVLERRH